MAPNPRVLKAFRAMKDIGISEDKTKPVLKKLLKLYDKNWELIEEENYRVLADSIFDEEDSKAIEEKKCQNSQVEDFGEEVQAPDEPERPLKRLRLRGQETQVDGMALKKPKLEEDVFPETCPKQQMQLSGSKRSETDPSSSRRVDKGKEPVSPHVVARVKKSSLERPSAAVRIKEPGAESGAKNSRVRASGAQALLKPKDEPFTDDTFTNEMPIAAIHPDSSRKEVYSIANDSVRKPDGQVAQASLPSDGSNKGDGMETSCKKITGSELATVTEEVHPNLEIASSPLGEVKISLSCDSAFGRPDFHIPSRDAVIKYMEEKCLQSYKIIDPTFSVMKLLSDMCECFLELGTDSPDEQQEGSISRIPLLDVMKNSDPIYNPGDVANEGDLNHLLTSVNEPVSPVSDREFASQVPSILESSSVSNDQAIHDASQSSKEMPNGHSEDVARKELDNLEAANPHNLMVVSPSQQATDDFSFSHDVNDITKGEERVQVPWVNEINKEHPPFFHYIPRSLIFQSAFVNFSLSLIGNDKCCESCFGNCLTSSVPCACARETGDNYAYTPEGLVKEDVLEEWISLARDSQGSHQFYCKECPLERSKNDDCLEPCKGHLERKLIKECWSKCGCSKHCGNRVVQRGITRKLQVFFTSEGKGWGLRTLEDLPKGSFVCEYAGEILTISEMYHRKVQNTKNGQHTDPVLLDAFWNKEEPFKEEKALCLDATNFGNVARFINHRCFDANLVDAAVEIETPDHHNYHLALFTTRKIDAMEELTWDYGIDFDDLDHPVKPFLCQCGSKFCRNMKRSSRSKSASSMR
ncbi:probable inactive histone-lysine N-methyltransferase SUVR2 isoform X1 [Cucurbita moschata]|uniref:Probable inactive histone-lysine N-methyltransferase SUVR2 isoform X1 n=1 Tax=Cucurbita moschata TaxID=3662 RepID=A0A6J1GNP0_CUCMO|nr:probable inactive histone-lysine N-methyltransferase SUVR2 isoform X1 [Cucurbita moschata]XP_022953601.1 probable inactive histone-lysine N-methyltransferase SUVR2 isoform X1 [Cucurbita moschata]XP_022953602.1 probable inactive histone-lysine N-methyltransferase SUVR2 isoform X1 [Cucurbita moschata]XP_022953603.1 probable inactive histone-lysine N-methyltransferase SUVR2 isoform X1 [Cucurbita moschata]